MNQILEYVNNHKEKVQKMRDFYLSYKVFCRDCLGFKDMNAVHDEMCDFMQNSTKSLLILMPRYTFKSSVVTAGYSLWNLIRNPNMRILIYSDSATKAQGFLLDIKNHILSSTGTSNFRDYFPEWESDVRTGKWNDSQIIVSVRESPQREPSIDTGGIESSKVGMHFDLIIFDDIVSDLNITTKSLMDKTTDCYKKALSLLTPTGKIIITGTRWHYGDTYGRIIKENKEKQNFDIFLKDAEEVRGGKLIFEDIGLTKDFLLKKRADQGSMIYSCLYRNSPTDDETAIFRQDLFSFYTPTPDTNKNLYITAVCDPAGEGEDFTAITVVGTDAFKKMYLLDAVNKHLKPNQIIDEVIRLNYKWGFDKFGIEKNFFKGLFESELRDAVKEETRNPHFKPFSVDELSATCADRNFTRILSLQPYHERGAILFPGRDLLSLNEDFTELSFQMMQFTIDGPKSPHDDLLVSLAYHTELIRPGGEVAKEEIPYTSAMWFEQEYLKEHEQMQRRLPRFLRKTITPSFT